MVRRVKTAAQQPSRTTQTAAQRVGLIGLDAAILAWLMVMPLAWLFDPLPLGNGAIQKALTWGWRPWLAGAALVVARAALASRIGSGGFLSRPVAKKLIASWIATWSFFIGIEGALRLAGVKTASTSPIVIRGEEDLDTKTRKGDEKVTVDPELLWRFTPGAMWDGIRVNSLGFRDREVSAQKPVGTKRVIAMGDSCTAQGQPPYSTVLHELLQQTRPTDAPWEAFNTGVFGYSAMQGLRQFQTKVRFLQPDVVTLYYGWNDHWLFTKPDHLRMAVRLHPLHAALMSGLQKKRFYNLLAQTVRPAGSVAVAEDSRTYRVPPRVYAATLKELVSEIRSVGAVPVLITAPRRDLTPAIVRSGHARSIEEVHRVHAEYVELTRSVAAETGAPLLDLASVMAAPEYDALFSGDGIHFDQAGLNFIAQQLHAKLMTLAASGVIR